jgi:hypothetical protein
MSKHLFILAYDSETDKWSWGDEKEARRLSKTVSEDYSLEDMTDPVAQVEARAISTLFSGMRLARTLGETNA